MHSWDEPAPLLPSLEVPDHTPVKTGVLDKYGKQIERQPNPVGFHCPRVKPRG